MFSAATCIRKANDSANIVAIKERALPITFDARSPCVKCNRNLYGGSWFGHVNTYRLENEIIFAESLALLTRVAAENIDQNRSSENALPGVEIFEITDLLAF